jgi:hypothetical protein
VADQRLREPFSTSAAKTNDGYGGSHNREAETARKIAGTISQFFFPIPSIWGSAIGILSFAEAFERHHDLVRLHTDAAFKVDKREHND